MKSYTHLKSENQNKNTLEIHKHSVVDILNKINDEDQKIANLVRDAIPMIRNTIDLTLKIDKIWRKGILRWSGNKWPIRCFGRIRDASDILCIKRCLYWCNSRRGKV